ncbi:MAG TPA: hypothetical protein VH020_15665 [Stellaceae bacterium]|nr:hypothetical protein [Stellaceae bacterium]
MADSRSAIDEAFDRYETLSRILEKARQSALSNPMHDRNIDLGLTQRGQKKGDAITRINETFEDLTSLINHLGILDMAAAFEKTFRARLGTAIGEARNVLRDNYKIETLRNVRQKLIHDPDNLRGLAKAISVIRATLSKEVAELLEAIRESRNNFAHGTDIRTPPGITAEKTKDTLNEIIKSL